MSSLLLVRLAVALVWLYQGFWCKLLGRTPHHEKIIGAAPIFGGSRAHLALGVLGGLECILAAWVLCGFYPREAALAQTALLGAMNAGGLIWARWFIPDPVGMLFQNFAFLLLAWVAAGELRPYAPIA